MIWEGKTFTMYIKSPQVHLKCKNYEHIYGILKKLICINIGIIKITLVIFYHVNFVKKLPDS